MNRHKSAPRFRPATYFTLIGTATIVAGGGVTHAIYKNRQIQVSREIDAIERRIEQCKLDISTIQMRTENLLDRYRIKEQLEASGSSLVSIPIGLPEEVRAAPPSAVAAVTQ
jgi:cell division protein FtsL